jgi:hypothetical protein
MSRVLSEATNRACQEQYIFVHFERDPLVDAFTGGVLLFACNFFARLYLLLYNNNIASYVFFAKHKHGAWAALLHDVYARK